MRLGSRYLGMTTCVSEELLTWVRSAGFRAVVLGRHMYLAFGRDLFSRVFHSLNGSGFLLLSPRAPCRMHHTTGSYYWRGNMLMLSPRPKASRMEQPHMSLLPLAHRAPPTVPPRNNFLVSFRVGFCQKDPITSLRGQTREVDHRVPVKCEKEGHGCPADREGARATEV